MSVREATAKLRGVYRRIMPASVRAPLYKFRESFYARENRYDPAGVSFSDASDRKRVRAALFKRNERVAVILGFGQSNIANEGDPAELYVPTKAVYNLNIHDGRCYVARDPLLGASADRSNFMTRLGDLLVTAGAYDRVLLVPIGHGGTYVADWVPGGSMFPRLDLALRRLRRAGVGVTHALWQQGEAEGAQSNPDAAAWMRHFRAIADVLRSRGVTAPLWVALCTLCRNQANETIRQAQRNVVDSALGIRAGPDTDTIGIEDRWDGCHFSQTGLKKCAALWFDAITKA